MTQEVTDGEPARHSSDWFDR